LARLKSNYQLGELVKVDNYPEVIKLVAEFTVTSLQVFIHRQYSISLLFLRYRKPFVARDRLLSGVSVHE